MKNLFISKKLSLVTFVIVSLLTLFYHADSFSNSTLASPGFNSTNINRFSNTTIRRKRTHIEYEEIKKLFVNQYTELLVDDVRTTFLFSYIAHYVRTNPEKIKEITALLRELGDKYDDDSYFHGFPGILQDNVEDIIFHLRILTVLENKIIEYENTKNPNILILSDKIDNNENLLTNICTNKFWLKYSDFREDEAKKAAQEMSNIYALYTDLLQAPLDIRHVEIDKKLDCISRIQSGELWRVDRENHRKPSNIFENLSAYAFDAKEFLKFAFFNLRQSDEIGEMPLTELFDEEFWRQKLEQSGVCDTIKLSNIMEVMEKIYEDIDFEMEKKQPNVDNVTVYNIVSAMQAKLEGREWLVYLGVELDYDYVSARTENDLKTFLTLYLKRKINIPLSQNVRDWRESINWDDLVDEISSDLFTNDQRLGSMIQRFWYQYRGLSEKHPSYTHNQTIIKLAEELDIIPRHPSEVFAKYIRIPFESEMRAVIQEQIKIVSFLLYELKRMMSSDAEQKIKFIDIPFENRPKELRKSYPVIRAMMKDMIENEKETYDDPEKIFTQVKTKLIMEINTLITSDELKIHPFIELSTIPEYPNLIRITEPEWEYVILNYLGHDPALAGKRNISKETDTDTSL